jgi:hypothetical protein
MAVPPQPSPQDRRRRFAEVHEVEAEVLEYGHPEAMAASRSVFDISTAVVLIPWAFVITILLAVVTPRFETIFRDFGTKLPTITLLLLQGSRVFVNNYGWVAVWAAAIGLPFAVAPLRRPERGRRRRSFAIAITILLCGATIALGLIALYAPMISLIQSVSGGAKK